MKSQEEKTRRGDKETRRERGTRGTEDKGNKIKSQVKRRREGNGRKGDGRWTEELLGKQGGIKQAQGEDGRPSNSEKLKRKIWV